MKINTPKSILFAAIAVMGISVISCSSPTEVEKTTLIHKISISNEDTTDGSQKYTVDPHSGKFCAHTDSLEHYGSGVVFTIPDSLIQKSIRVKVNTWIKQSASSPKNQYAVSLEAPDRTIIQWNGIVTDRHVSEFNKWVNLNDSITIPADLINKSGLNLRMFPYNPEGKTSMDIDDTEISIYKVEKEMTE
jgi:hypothetical protein